MAQFNQDFVMFAGNDEKVRFTNVFNELTGQIVAKDDIIGASWGFTPYEDETEILVVKDLVSGGIEIPDDGFVIVSLSESDTEGLSGEFTHELRLRHDGGVVTAARGRMTIKYRATNIPL